MNKDGDKIVAYWQQRQEKIVKLLNFAAILKMPRASMYQDMRYWREYLKGRLN